MPIGISNLLAILSRFATTILMPDKLMKIGFSIKMTLLFSIPLTSLYAFPPNSLAKFLYDDLELGKFIHIMSYNTIFLSLQNILSDILHGLNKQVYTSINILIGALCVLKSMMKLKIDYIDIILKPLFSVAFMILSMKAFLRFEFNIGYKTILFLSLLLGCGVYLMILYILFDARGTVK